MVKLTTQSNSTCLLRCFLLTQVLNTMSSDSILNTPLRIQIWIEMITGSISTESIISWNSFSTIHTLFEQGQTATGIFDISLAEVSLPELRTRSKSVS
jgi:hypothetical protein